MKPDVVIVGWGPTLDDYDWSDDAPVCAVSGAIYHCKRKPDYWISFDQPWHYHAHKDNPTIVKHVQWRIEEWAKYPNIHPWVVRNNPLPRLQKTDPEPTVSSGVLFGLVSSMLAAVQIMGQEGYKSFLFVGCDFIHGYGESICSALKIWKPHFERAGIEWAVSSPQSRMSEFCTELVCG